MILILGHVASYSGAPKLLLNFNRWLRQRGVDTIVLLNKGGSLVPSYQDVGETHVWERVGGSPFRAWVEAKRAHYFGLSLKQRRILAKVKRVKPSIIFSNTILNGNILKFLPEDIPVITHVHELDLVIQAYYEDREIPYTLKRTDHFLVVSDAVKSHLMDQYGVPENKITKVYAFPPDMICNQVSSSKDVRMSLGIPANAHIVGACGAIEWRKGTDLFIETAWHVSKKFKNQEIYFVWIGGGTDTFYFKQLLQDAKLRNVSSFMRFPGSMADFSDIYKEMDLFLMLSREDPFPLVNLEAASHGVPIICFDKKAGGSAEFVTKNCGVVVDYGDTFAVARHLVELLDDDERRSQFSINIKERVKEFTIDRFGEEVCALINSVTGMARG
jgi:glycosyltransferase involved in cell wall biosynthesis